MCFDFQKCILVFIESVCYSCHMLMKHEFSRQIFYKCSIIKLHVNASSGSRAVPYLGTDGQTDRDDEANCRFSQFCERA